MALNTRVTQLSVFALCTALGTQVTQVSSHQLTRSLTSRVTQLSVSSLCTSLASRTTQLSVSALTKIGAAIRRRFTRIPPKPGAKARGPNHPPHIQI